MKKCLKIIIVFLFVFQGHAAAQLFIEEGKIKRVVSPGQVLADTINVHNSTNQTVEVEIYFEDFEYVAPFDGTKKFYPAGALDRSAADWINFQPRQMTLAPHARQKLNFTINVPKDASGGHYGVLFFERKDIQQIEGQVGLQIISRVGSLLFLETADRKKQVQVNELSFEKGVLKAKVTNTGNIYVVAQCLYYVLDKDGIPVDRGEVGPFYLSEDNQTDIMIEFSRNLSSGMYSAILTFDLEDGVSFVEEVGFRVDQAGMFHKQ